MEKLQLTPAQKELLDLLNHKEVHDFYTSLKVVHYLGTYYVGNDIVDLSASRYVHDLLDALQKIVKEDKKCV